MRAYKRECGAAVLSMDKIETEAGGDAVVEAWAQSWAEYFQRDAVSVNQEVKNLRARLYHAAAVLDES